MGNGTSIGKFNGLTTAGGGLFFDVGAQSRNAGSLSRDPGALIANPDALSSNPEALSFDPAALSRDPDGLSFDPDALRFDPDALRFDPDALRFDPDALSFDAETLSFDVFYQRRGSNGLLFSHLRNICKNRQRIGRAALLRGLGRPAGRPYHKNVSSKRSKCIFSRTFNIQHSTLN